MHDGRKRITVVLATLFAVLAAAMVWTLGPGTPTATAKPDLATVKKQVEKLNHQAEQASERYNDARVKLSETRTRLGALDSDLARQQKVVDDLREQVAAMVVRQYQGDVLSTTSQVVLSDDPDAFLDNLNAVSAYNDQRGEVMTEFGTELDRLKLRKDAVQDEARRLAKIEKKMKAEKAAIDEKAGKAQDLLDELEAEARAELLGGGEFTGELPDVPASGRAAVAIRYAMAQVGKSYVYGAAGPNSFDCSGLTMRAWGAAGVGLPHSSRAQQGTGTPVSSSALQPGDLVFYYSPVSHVAMYIGDGMIVHAANPGAGVRVSPLYSMPYVGAVRPG